MAYKASEIEKGTYLILQDLQIVKILEARSETLRREILLRELNIMLEKWNIKFDKQYKGSWDTYTKKET